MRHKEFWIALGIGALAGGIAALLYAPQSGASTRKKLKRGIEDLGDTLQESAEYLKKQAECLAKEAQKLVDYTQSKAEDFGDSTKGYVNLASQGVKAVRRMM